MDFKQNPNICSLCLNKSENCINIYEKYGNCTNIRSILTQHFWFLVSKF